MNSSTKSHGTDEPMKAKKLYDDIRNMTQLIESCEAMWDRLKSDHDDASFEDNADHDTLAKRLSEQPVREVWVNFQDLLSNLRTLTAEARAEIAQDYEDSGIEDKVLALRKQGDELWESGDKSGAAKLHEQAAAMQREGGWHAR